MFDYPKSMNWILVGIGGFIGSVLRYVVTWTITYQVGVTLFPLGTFLVNIIGCLFIGFFTAYFNNLSQISLFLITGLLGGFTTFSAFSIENFNLLKDGNYLVFSAYTTLSVLFGLLGVVLGIYIGGKI